MKKSIFTVLLGGLIALVLTTPVLAATTVSLSPAVVNVIEGQNFNLTVKIDPQGLKNYTAKIELTYPADLLRVNSFTFGSSWMPVSQPGYDSIDNTSGVLIKTAGYPGGVTSQATFGIVSFSAKKAGNGIIKMGNDSLALNATNQNLLGETAVQTSFTITAPVLVPTEERITEEEVIGEEETPISEELVEEVTRDEIFQRSLLANMAVTWGGTGQLTLVIVIASIFLIALVFIGLKEWKAFQRKKNN